MGKKNFKAAKPLNILVTGGAGFLGSVLVPMLLKEGHRVRVLDQFYFGDGGLASVINHPNLSILKEDILYQENIPGLFENIDSVVHLASISNDPSCDLDPNLTIQTNFLATMSLARRAQSAGVKQFIFISSCSVYGASGDKMLDINSRTAPATLYALTKLQCERELASLCSNKFSVCIFRFATLFGYSPRMRFDLAVNAMTKHALQGKNIIVNGDGKQYRPFLHVFDAARAIRHVLTISKKLTTGRIFNVGNEKLNYTIANLAKEILAKFPHLKIDQVVLNNDVRSYRVRFKRFHKECGFTTEKTIGDGILEIKKAFENGQLTNMDDERFYNVMVMKHTARQPFMVHSLASSPLWLSKEPLIRST